MKAGMAVLNYIHVQKDDRRGKVMNEEEKR